MNVAIFRSIRFRIPLVVLTGVIPLIIVTFLYASKQAAKKIRQEAKENMALKADLLAESVNRWNELNAKALLNLSSQPDLRSMDPQRQEAVLKNTVNTYDHFYLAMTTDLNGWNVARSDKPEKVFFGDRDWFLIAKAGNYLTYQTLMSRTSKKLASCLSVPIRDAQTEIIGVTVGCINLEDIAREIYSLKFGKTGYAILVDELGTVLAHPEQQLVSGRRLKDLSSYPPVKSLLSGNRGHFSYYDYEGVKWVSYVVNLNNNWGIVVVQEQKDFLHNERDFQNLALTIAVVSILGVSFLTLVLANRLIDPIGNLTDAASAIARGELDRRVAINRTDELGILANSFNSMAERLKNSFSNLELLIERRTNQLKVAKEAAEKAKEAAEAGSLAKDKFLVNISHELRTPLNAIIGYGRILRRSEQQSERILGLRIIEQSGTHLLALINDLLDFAKSKAGKMELHLEPLNLQEFLEEVAGTIEMSAIEKNIEFKSELAGNLPRKIMADSKRLRQVLFNLLGNAVKFTDCGEVRLKVTQKNNLNSQTGKRKSRIRFEVIDTGIGISTSQLQKIFQPFEQVAELESRTTGTGLGLSVALELVELMGSKIEVKSELDRGSTFWFDLTFETIALSTEEFIKPQKNTGEITSYSGPCQYKILVIDDLKENRMLLQNLLEPLGFKIVQATNGQSGLETAKTFEPDLILTDLLMPEKTGLRMVIELRKMRDFKETPIIGLSACTSEVMEHKSKCVGCNAFLSKPIDEKKLLSLLQWYLPLEWNYAAVNVK